MNRKRLLSVDWDFFFLERSQDPEQWQYYDWGHREAMFFIDHAWYSRAQAFLMNGMPLPQTTGEEVGFWDRFKFRPSCRLYVAESHAEIYTPRVRKGITEIVNYDAHHDAGYNTTFAEWLKTGRVACEDWVCGYQIGGVPTTTVYPRWKTWAMDMEPEPIVPTTRRYDDGEPDPEPFDRVFVCRSGAWTPSWLDERFQAFLAAFPGRKPHHTLTLPERVWDLGALRAQVEAYLLSLTLKVEKGQVTEGQPSQFDRMMKERLERALGMLDSPADPAA